MRGTDHILFVEVVVARYSLAAISISYRDQIGKWHSFLNVKERKVLKFHKTNNAASKVSKFYIAGRGIEKFVTHSEILPQNWTANTHLNVQQNHQFETKIHGNDFSLNPTYTNAILTNALTNAILLIHCKNRHTFLINVYF